MHRLGLTARPPNLAMPKPPSAPPASHVASAIAAGRGGAAQPKPAAAGQPKTALAPHVAATVAAGRGGASLQRMDDRRRRVGVPPSAEVKIGKGAKYTSESNYRDRKILKQQGREHVSPDLVEKTLKKASGGAEQVSLVLRIAGGDPIVVAPGAGSDEHAHFFSVPFSRHNHEIDTSSNDAEVRQLSTAYDLCLKDFLTHQYTESTEPRLHHVALVGPWGPCDGCKERIRAFKSHWQQAAAENNCSARLVLTYFYRYEARGISRQGETYYGYYEALRGDDLRLPELGAKKVRAPQDIYWYRSTGSSFDFEGWD